MTAIIRCKNKTVVVMTAVMITVTATTTTICTAVITTRMTEMRLTRRHESYFQRTMAGTTGRRLLAAAVGVIRIVAEAWMLAMTCMHSRRLPLVEIYLVTKTATTCTTKVSIIIVTIIHEVEWCRVVAVVILRPRTGTALLAS